MMILECNMLVPPEKLSLLEQYDLAVYILDKAYALYERKNEERYMVVIDKQFKIIEDLKEKLKAYA